MLPSKNRAVFQCAEFVSDYGARRVREHVISQGGNSAREMYLRLKAASATPDTLGRLFEAVIISAVKSEGCIHSSFRQVKLDGSIGLLKPWHPSVDIVSTFAGSDLASITSSIAPHLYIPSHSNFPVVDAILVDGSDVTLIQITVAGSHKPTLSQVTHLLGSIDSSLKIGKLVWIVNDESELCQWQGLVDDTTNSSAYNDVDQFVCKYYLSAPVCWVKRDDPTTNAICLPHQLDKVGLLKMVQRDVDPDAKRLSRFVSSSTATNPSKFS